MTLQYFRSKTWECTLHIKEPIINVLEKNVCGGLNLPFVLYLYHIFIVCFSIAKVLPFLFIGIHYMSINIKRVNMFVSNCVWCHLSECNLLIWTMEYYAFMFGRIKSLFLWKNIMCVCLVQWSHAESIFPLAYSAVIDFIPETIFIGLKLCFSNII